MCAPADSAAINQSSRARAASAIFTPSCDVRLPEAVKIRTKQAPVSIVSRTARHSERQQQQQHPVRPPPPPSPVVLCGATGPYTDPTANGCSSGRPIAAAPKTASKIETMAEAQRLIGISLAKIAQSRVCRGGVSLHKNLLVATVLQKARYIFMEEAYHIVHGHYLQQQQQQQQQHHHQQLMQEQQNAAYLLAGHCDGSPADDGGCDDDCSNNNNNNNNNSKCSSGLDEEEEKQQQQQQLLAARCSPVEELVDPVEEEEDGTTTTLSYDCDTINTTTTTTILPTTIGSLGPLEPLNMCRNNGSSPSAAAPAGDAHEQADEEEEEEEKQTSTCQDVAAHLFLLPALAPWIGAPEDNKENIGSSFSFLPAAASPFHYHHDEEEEDQEDEEEEEEEENTCQDLSCHRRKQEAADQQPELARKQLGALRYFDLDDRRTARHERRRRRHRTEGDDEQQAFPPVPAKRRRSSDWDRSAVELPHDQQAMTNDDRIHPIPLLSAKRLKTIDNQQQQQQQPRPLTPALCPQPQFYSSPHETICPGDAETLSACVNQQLEAENLSTSGGSSSNTSPPLTVEEPEVEQHQQHPEETDAAAPAPAPSVESIDRITSLVSIFSFGNLSRSVSTPDVFCAAQAQKDARPDAGGSLLTSQLQHHGQRGYLTMTV